jgi:hypothetical protein
MPRRRAARARAPGAARTRPTEAETRLLALARELTALPAAGGVAAALRRLAAAHAPDAPLPRAVARAGAGGRADKTAALALAWAREQVRLALEEVLARAATRGALPGGPDTRAWLLLAAAESLAHEPPAAAADRLRALLDLAGAE